MGMSELRQLDARFLKSDKRLGDTGRDLVRAGAISHADAALAHMVGPHCDASIDRILQSEGLAETRDILAARHDDPAASQQPTATRWLHY